jgi:glycosyltransferase involved in cell wall biosynthesis
MWISRGGDQAGAPGTRSGPVADLPRMLDVMAGRIALLTPFAAPAIGGNAVTVDRIARGLGRRGLSVRVWDVGTTPEAVLENDLARFRPDLVHGFHAYRVGPLALRLSRRLGVPLVITLTGTDANHDLFDASRAPSVQPVVEEAAALVVFHESVRDRVAGVVPDVAPRVHVIAQAPDLEGDEPFDLEKHWALPPDRVLFLFPAGIRPVKGPRVPLVPFDDLVTRIPSLRLLYAGPIVDPAEGHALLAALASRPWARHIGAVPHARMRSLLAQSDVVLNCSRSEGGMSNAVLEALAVGRAVLVSDIEGNRSLVDDGVTGLTFCDAHELGAAAERLARDGALRTRLGAAGAARVAALTSPAREIDGHLAVYRALLGESVASESTVAR